MLLLLLIASTPPDYERSVASLEEAFRSAPLPEILLSIASTYEAWDGHCKEAVETYGRFFETCRGCPALAGAADRFDLALERCVSSTEEEMALRERFVVPARKARPRKEGDASRSELADLLRRSRGIDRAETGRLFVTMIEAGTDASIPVLNDLREQAWTLLLRRDADPEEALALVGRIRVASPDVYAELLDRLVTAQRSDDQAALNAIRLGAMEAARGQSTKIQEPRPADGCAANPAYETGFLTVNTSPWSEVYLNGEPVGTTPLHKLKVVAGCVTIRARSPVSGREAVANTTIRPNRVTRLSFELETYPPQAE